MTEQRTLRSKKLREALHRSTDGKCAICFAELPDNWHADHVVPWRDTHRTNVHEMQPLCPACNLTKGARVSTMKLREHQQQFDEYMRDLSVNDLPKTVLLHVTPGGGKSIIPQIIKKHFPSLKIAWFVPRRSLLRQAARSCMAGRVAKMRLVELEGFEINPSKGEDGFVATHNALAQNPQGFLQELKKHNYALVIDEAHHGKADPRTEVAQPVGAAFKALYNAARLRVDLSGTLETADGKLIVGVGYREEGGQLIPAAEQSHDKVIRYTRAQAIRDHAVVPVVFDHHDGEVEWTEDSEQFKGTLSDMPKDKLGRALWVALRSDIADKMFLRGVDHWKKNSTGKLIVVADRQDNAKVYAKRLQGMGIECSLAIDDNEEAEADVRRFLDERTGDDAVSPTRAMVTCQMAYEGLDVPSATHLICLTHIRSAPWIEQMLGRIWRSTEEKSECYAFVPDDSMMREVIDRIRREEMEGVSMGEEREKREGTSPQQMGLIYDIGSRMTNVRTTTLDGGKVVPVLGAVAAARKVLDGLTEGERAQLIDELIGASRQKPGEPEATPAEQRESLRERIKELTRRVAKAIADRNGTRPDWRQPYVWLMSKTGKAVDRMTITELSGAAKHLEGYLAKLAA